MTIVYPLQFPTHIGPSAVSFRAVNRTALTGSPFTFQQQAIPHTGKKWEAMVTLPPMGRDDAEQWLAWLISLKGHEGTFVMGDPTGATPRGSMAGETRRNLLTYSEQFDNAAWALYSAGTGSTPVVTANIITDPNSGSTADRVVFSAGAGGTTADTSTIGNGAGPAMVMNVGDQYAWGTYIKSASGGEVLEARQAGKATWTTINVTTSWQRVSAVETAAGTFAPLYIRFNGTNGTSATVHLWGAQVEAGTTLGAYQQVASTVGPAVNGASQTGSSLIMDGAGTSETNWAKAGDYLQLGSGSGSHLHKILNNADSDASGNVTVDIWPDLRTSPADNDPVIVDNTQALWRLTSNSSDWDISDVQHYGITFSAVEALS